MKFFTPFQILALTFFVVSCGDDSSDVPRVVSPAGRTFYFQDLGSAAFGISVGGEFDQAVADSKAYLWRYGIEPSDVDAALGRVTTSVVDHFLILTSASPTGAAAGIYWDGVRAIQLALYTRQRNVTGPPHTHYTWPTTGETHSGILPAPCPALGHELGHYFFGGAFEHGWTPPIVNPPPLVVAAETIDWSQWCVVRP